MDVARPAARSTRARALAAPEAHSAALSTKENSVGRGAVASAASAQGKGYQASPLRPHNAQPLKANAGDNIAKPESKAAGAKAAPEPELYETIEEKSSTGEVVRRYLKGKLLGKGGFAKAYWCTCLQTQKQYALKVVLKETLTKPKAKAKLQCEVKIHSILRHPHVVRFHHFFEDDKAYYMLLELAHNKSFSELMKKRKRLTEPEVQYYMLQILSALEYMHGIGVIHRDLKLGNLLLDKGMGVKIGDLGLAAKLTDANERKRTLCGTPNYIAPEILENKNGHSFEVDIWSTGVVMYTMLVGRPPYESKDVKATYKRILANDFAFPDHVPLSSASVDLIKQMLVTNPAQRPSLKHIQAHPFFTRGGHHAPPTSMPLSALITPPTSSSSSSSAAPRTATTTANAEYGAPTTGDAAAAAVKASPLIPHPEGVGAKASSRPSSSSSNAASGRVVAKHPSEVQQEVLTRRAAAAAAANHGAARLTGGGKAGTTTAAATSSAASSAAAAVTPQVDELAAMRASSNSSSKGVLHGGGGDEKLLGGSSSGGRPVRRSRSSSGLRTGNAGVQQPPSSSAAVASSSSGKGSATANAPTTFNDALSAESDHKKPSNAAAVVPSSASSAAAAAPHLRSASGRGRSASRTRPSAPPSSSSSAVQHQPPASSPGFAAMAVVAEPTTGAGAMAATTTLSSSAQFHGTATLEKQFAGLAVSSSSNSTKGGHNGATTAAATMEPGSLESIHAQLAATMAALEAKQGQPSSSSGSAVGNSKSSSSSAAVNAPALWVTQYVDYTSKYGLGYLLSDGSTGVYFNDSTKIVLAASGDVFQYMERVRSSDAAAADGKAGTTSERFEEHTLDNYPPGLHKKVTLLQHFRDYLLQQQKEKTEKDAAAAAAASTSSNQGAEANHGPPKEPRAAWGEQQQVGGGSSSSSSSPHGGGGGLAFVKKWVRTRHAILFRLSNGTVQVMFLDNTEVLLAAGNNNNSGSNFTATAGSSSSGYSGYSGGCVTFADKQGSRRSMTLSDVVANPRSDVTKRLKYTKDILRQLISSGKK